MYNFRFLLGTRICQADEKIYRRFEFQGKSLASARRKVTNFTKSMGLEVLGRKATWEKWDSGNSRFTRRRCHQNCVLYMWLVSLDEDIKKLP